VSQHDVVGTDSKPAAAESSGLAALIKSVNSGDDTALERLRDYLEGDRDAAMCLGGDLSWEATAKLVMQLTGENCAMREAVFQELLNLRDELRGENQTPIGLERLLIENVVGTWLHFHRLELLYASQRKPTFHSDSFYQKELSAAHKRYLAAMRTLIDARRRPLPNIQINVANEQLNVAGNVTAAPPPPKETPAPLG
jgi:hypothetical protein